MRNVWPLAVVLGACNGPTSGEALPDPIDAVELTIDPVEATVATSPDSQETLQFTAWVTFEDGEVIEAEHMEWTVSNRSAGTIDESGLFTPSEKNGGVTWVTADYGALTAQATVVVVYQDQQIEDGADSAAFSGTEVAMETSPWLYPEDGVNIPRNTPSVFFQWADLGADAYRLRFQSRVSDITVYTAENGWASEGENWQIIAGTNAGGTVEVELAAAIGGEVHVAAPQSIGVNRLDARGAIYYWSSSVEGIKKIPYGEPEPENFFSKYELDGVCIGCHTIGPKPENQLAYSYVPQGASQDEGYLEITAGLDDDALDTTLVSQSDGYRSSFKTWSPDGQWLISLEGGRMYLFEAATGAYVGDVTPDTDDLNEPRGVSQAEWSPDGSQLAVAWADLIQLDISSYGNRIAVMDHLGDGQFGDLQVLVDPIALTGADNANAYYPTWSPDGEWIAFNMSTGNTHDDEDAALWVVSKDGGDPIELAAANSAPNLTNSWPKWGPLPDDDILWLTFSSRRDYGYTTTSGTPQIWVTAFDPSRIEEGLDPSWPAFWLPGQTSDENNHLPVWVD